MLRSHPCHSSKRLTRGAVLLCAISTLALLHAGSAQAELDLQLINQDAPEQGFNDSTPAEALPGNPALTLGEQRWNAVLAAAERWAEVLDGNVAVRAGASFAPDPALSCNAESVTAAQGTAPLLQQGDRFLPAALARALFPDVAAAPNDAELILRFNPLLGSDACPGSAPWSYALPNSAGTQTPGPQLLAIALHELAHGLGLTTSLDLNGALPANTTEFADPYTSLAYSHQFAAPLTALNSEQQRRALTTPRDVVWLGPATRRAAAELLARGLPQLFLPSTDGNADAGNRTPAWTSTGEDVAEFLPALAFEPVEAPLRTVDTRTLCAGDADVAGFIIVVESGLCSAADKAFLAADLGALGLVLHSEDSPARSVHLGPEALAPLPAVLLGTEPFALAQQAATNEDTALLYQDPRRLVGADPAGRPYLYTPEGLTPGSTLTHLDPLVRLSENDRALLMEPDLAEPNPALQLDLALPMLLDLGWGHPNCGDGTVNAVETCDDPSGNSDSTQNTCRTDCTPAHCGDAYVDSDEQCDHGELNDDTLPDACRNDCTLAHCGDGILDLLLREHCDDGPAGSPTCTATCTHRPQALYDAGTPISADAGTNVSAETTPDAGHTVPSRPAPEPSDTSPTPDGGPDTSATATGCACRQGLPAGTAHPWAALAFVVALAFIRRGTA